MKNKIPQLLFLFALIVSLSSCTLETVTYKGIENIKLREFKGKKVSLSCDIILDNPNAHTLKIRPSSFDIYLNDSPLGKARLDDKIKIFKNSESAVMVPITIELYENTLPTLIGATLQKTTHIRLVGTAKGGILIFGARRKIDVSHDISLRNLKLSNLPLFKK